MKTVKNALQGNYKANTRPNPITACPLTAMHAAIGGKWKLLILYHLGSSPLHFATLRRELPKISPKVLTEQLSQLCVEGLICRQSTGSVPSPVIYSLTAYGRTALPLVEQARQWGAHHIERYDTQAVNSVSSPPPVSVPGKCGSDF